MARSKRKKGIIIGIVLFLLMLALAAGGLYYYDILSYPYEQDAKHIREEEYDTVLLSTYPIAHYDMEILSYYRAMDALLTTGVIRNYKMLQQYLQNIADSGQAVETVYLGITPGLISVNELQEVAYAYPQIDFQVILAYPSLTYWTALRDTEYRNLLDAYQSYRPEFLEASNMHLYLYSGAEWIIDNSLSYDDVWQASEGLASFILRTADENAGFQLTPSTAQEAYDQLALLTSSRRNTPITYPDWSDRTFVFFGDSVIGNYTDFSSIPSVVSGLTGAEVYNCGFGGGSTAENKTVPESLSFPDIATSLVSQDLTPLPTNAQCYIGLSSFLEKYREQTPEQLYFVISYGLNDFFSGLPVSNVDPYDNSSYEGALRLALTQLLETYPDAHILLLTPTPNIYHDFGAGTGSPEGGTLLDYVDAVFALGQELELPVLNTYETLGIMPDNWFTMLPDGVHPNEPTRYEIGLQIINALHSLE